MFNSISEIRDAGRCLRSRINEGPEAVENFYEEVYDLARAGEVDFNRVSIRSLFEHTVSDGHEAIQHMAPNYHADGRTWMMEAGDVVDTSHFTNIFGQLTYANVLATYNDPMFIGGELMTTVPASTQYEEVVPGVAKIGDVGQEIGEGELYPEVGLSEHYVTMPRKIKTGFQISVTEEALWEDKNGLINQRLNGATQALALNEEKEKLDVALGQSTLYSRNGGAAQATYGNTHTNGDFDNLLTAVLVNYADIEEALLLFDAITDPDTGEPIMLGSSLQLVVPTALGMTASIAVAPTTTYQDGDTTAAGPVRIHANPVTSLGHTFTVLSNQYVKARTSSAVNWFLGDFKAAFEYREIWPLQLFKADADRNDRNSRDIITTVRVRRKGRAGVKEPRHVVKSAGTG